MEKSKLQLEVLQRYARSSLAYCCPVLRAFSGRPELSSRKEEYKSLPQVVPMLVWQTQRNVLLIRTPFAGIGSMKE